MKKRNFNRGYFDLQNQKNRKTTKKESSAVKKITGVFGTIIVLGGMGYFAIHSQDNNTEFQDACLKKGKNYKTSEITATDMLLCKEGTLEQNEQ